MTLKRLLTEATTLSGVARKLLLSSLLLSAPVVAYSKEPLKVVECVAPDKPRFIYRDAEEIVLKDGVLVIKAPNSTVLYSIPAGTACEIRPGTAPSGGTSGTL